MERSGPSSWAGRAAALAGLEPSSPTIVATRSGRVLKAVEAGDALRRRINHTFSHSHHLSSFVGSVCTDPPGCTLSACREVLRVHRTLLLGGVRPLIVRRQSRLPLRSGCLSFPSAAVSPGTYPRVQSVHCSTPEYIALCFCSERWLRANRWAGFLAVCLDAPRRVQLHPARNRTLGALPSALETTAPAVARNGMPGRIARHKYMYAFSLSIKLVGYLIFCSFSESFLFTH